MPHFTVVPVQDNSPSNYDSLEGINWVDYRDTGQGGYPGHGDTVSSDGKFFSFIRHFVKNRPRGVNLGLTNSGAEFESLI